MRHYILPRFGTPTAAAILEFGDLTVFRFVPNSDIFQKDSFFFFFFFYPRNRCPAGTKLYGSPYAYGVSLPDSLFLRTRVGVGALFHFSVRPLSF